MNALDLYTIIDPDDQTEAIRATDALSALDSLSPEKRLKVLHLFCPHCGATQWRNPTDKHGCLCMRDE